MELNQTSRVSHRLKSMKTNTDFLGGNYCNIWKWPKKSLHVGLDISEVNETSRHPGCKRLLRTKSYAFCGKVSIHFLASLSWARKMF